MSVPSSPSAFSLHPSSLSPASLSALIQGGIIWPGDAILYRYADPSWLQRAIASTQRRALLDLYDIPADSVPGEVDPDPRLPVGPAQLHPSLYTHAGMVLHSGATVEMTSPACRTAPWDTVLSGVASVAVVRPRGATRRQTRVARSEALADIGQPYPYRELLLYWVWSWSWRKLHGKTPFSRVFRSRQRNVCSGSLIAWWQFAGIDLGLSGLDTWHEAWYPARLLVDPRFELVATLGTPGSSLASSPLSGDRSTHSDNGNEPSPARPRPQAASTPSGSAVPVPHSLDVERSKLNVERSAFSPVPAGGSPSSLSSSALLLLFLRASGGALQTRGPWPVASCQ